MENLENHQDIAWAPLLLSGAKAVGSNLAIMGATGAVMHGAGKLMAGANKAPASQIDNKDMEENMDEKDLVATQAVEAIEGGDVETQSDGLIVPIAAGLGGAALGAGAGHLLTKKDIMYNTSPTYKATGISEKKLNELKAQDSEEGKEEESMVEETQQDLAFVPAAIGTAIAAPAIGKAVSGVVKSVKGDSKQDSKETQCDFGAFSGVADMVQDSEEEEKSKDIGYDELLAKYEELKAKMDKIDSDETAIVDAEDEVKVVEMEDQLRDINDRFASKENMIKIPVRTTRDTSVSYAKKVIANNKGLIGQEHIGTVVLIDNVEVDSVAMPAMVSAIESIKAKVKSHVSKDAKAVARQAGFDAMGNKVIKNWR